MKTPHCSSRPFLTLRQRDHQNLVANCASREAIMWRPIDFTWTVASWSLFKNQKSARSTRPDRNGPTTQKVPRKLGQAVAAKGPLGRGTPASVHDALNHQIASETSEYLTFVMEIVIGVRARAGKRRRLAAKWTERLIVHAEASRFLS
jgi:hypothetical protein